MHPVTQIGNLNNHQIEIIKLFNRNLDDNDLIEIKKMITKYLSQKVTRMADDVWDKNNWTNDDMDRILTSHERTSYNPEN